MPVHFTDARADRGRGRRSARAARALSAAGLLAAGLCVVGASVAGASVGAEDAGTSQQLAPSIESNANYINVSGAPLAGTGSSFAAPAILNWTEQVKSSPYSLNVNYTSANSGQGRFEFTNNTTDYAVSDVGYVGSTDNSPPSFPFIFVPITAGGIAFMYNVPGLTKTLQLSSYTTCLLLTGGVKTWNDPNIAKDNPGVALPNTPVVPVTENDSAGTNYVLEEWCIAEQPAVWAAFVAAQKAQPLGVTDGVALSSSSPNSEWPGIQGGLDQTSTTGVAGAVATNAGAIGAVQVSYATDQQGFSGSDPSKSVALMLNASGDYVGPTAVNVASALAYATQQANGTHQLDFNGVGAHVYNPSTYSYLLTPTTGWSAQKGVTMSAFVDYVLTLGQKSVPNGYASLGLSLEQYGVNAVKQFVPGAVATTAAEQTAYACGDLTPAEVANNQTTVTCGVQQATVTATASSGTAKGGGTPTTPGSTAANGSHSAASTGTGAPTSFVSGSGPLGGVDPFISLSGPLGGLPNTGADVLPLTALGTSLLLLGWIGRRRFGQRSEWVAHTSWEERGVK